MDYRPTHVMMRKQDLNFRKPGHYGTLERVETDVVLPVIAYLVSPRGNLVVQLPCKDYVPFAWWVGFTLGSDIGDDYGYAIDMSLPHLHED